MDLILIDAYSVVEIDQDHAKAVVVRTRLVSTSMELINVPRPP
jgi:hypothetical protein